MESLSIVTRKYLLWIKSKIKYRKKAKRYIVVGFLLMILLSFICTKIDGLENKNVFIYFLRAYISSIIAIILCHEVFIIQNIREKNLNIWNRDKKRRLKEKLSYKQRRNLFVIILIITTLFHLFLVTPTNPYYSTISGLVLGFLLSFIPFLLKTKKELELERRGESDIRDLEEKYKKLDKILEEAKSEKN